MEGNESHITELYPGETRAFDQIQGLPFYSKIKLRDLKPPITLKFRYETPGKILLTGSYTHKEPNYHSNQFCTCTRQQVIKIFPVLDNTHREKHLFHPDAEYFYLCLESADEVRIKF